MSWEDMLKKQNKPTPDDISFMERMLNEVLSKVGSIYGLVPKQISNQNYEGFPAGYYYSPEAVVEYAFNVGFEENADGFVVDKTSGSGNPAKQGADWQNLWGYGFKDKIMNLPEEYRNMDDFDEQLEEMENIVKELPSSYEFLRKNIYN